MSIFKKVKKLILYHFLLLKIYIILTKKTFLSITNKFQFLLIF